MSAEPESETELRVPPSDNSDRNPVDVLADEFLTRLRNGEHPSILDYASRYPDLADEIEALFPALGMLEQAGLHDELDGPSGNVEFSTAIPERLGEYRIIREIGRGGMGVVYEAEHDTMRRRVALKVLPPEAAVNSRWLQRFHREARSAGRLHHTNIVPVFEVGSQGGIHFYSMQYIQGQSLDKVIDELRRLQHEAGSPGDGAADGATDPLGQSLAKSLQEGRFEQHSAVAVESDSHMATPRTSPDSPSSDSDVGHAAAAMGRVGFTSSDVMSWNDVTTSTDPRDHYYQRIARIALQVADALSCAHEQSVLHRDIKPANLILDTVGSVWVTDFGLARGDDDGLTQTGDFVGTLRYMAPERIRSETTDARSDIFALGLTLYELATLRPAFAQSDRARLLHCIANEEPGLPRKFNRRIPVDLETVILKAIEKDPTRRYQSASVMAEDLRLFLADRPVQARRISGLERAWRWCRRNPYQAMFPALLSLLVVAGTIGMFVFAVTTQRHARELAGAELQSRRLLYRSHVDRAGAVRQTGRQGQRTEAMHAIQSAVSLLPHLGFSQAQMAAERSGLRNHVFGSLALSDLEGPIGRLRKTATPWTIRAVDAAYERYALADDQGNVSVRRFRDDQEVAHLPGTGVPVWRVKFSPDGRFLYARYHRSGRSEPGRQVVWNLASQTTPIRENFIQGLDAAAFHPTRPEILLAAGHGRLSRFHCVTGELTGTYDIDFDPIDVEFHPNGSRFACAGKGPVRIVDSSGNIERLLNASAVSLAWSGDGKVLAGGASDGSIRVWRDGRRNHGLLRGHELQVTAVRLSFDGSRLLSMSWDNTVRVWNTSFARQEILLDDVEMLECRISRDGRIGLVRNDTELGLWKLSDGYAEVLPEMSGEMAQYQPGGARTLAVATYQGLDLWNTDSRKIVASVPSGRTYDFDFSADGRTLVTCSGVSGVQRWTISGDPQDEGNVAFGEPELVSVADCHCVSVDGSASTVAMRLDGHAVVVLSTERPDAVEIVHEKAGDVALSPDGKWLVTTTWIGKGVKLWNAMTGDCVCDLVPDAGHSRAVFSADGEWLAVATGTESLTWRAGDWNQPHRIPKSGKTTPRGLALSHDARILTSLSAHRTLRLLDRETGQPLGQIGVPGALRVHRVAFNEDGSEATVQFGPHLQVWKLSKVRETLRDLSLDLPAGS